MPKIRFSPDEQYPRTVVLVDGHPEREVAPGQIVEVDAKRVYNFTQQAIWEPSDAEAKKIHKQAESPAEDEAAPAAEEV